jgi:putative phosphoesterase
MMKSMNVPTIIVASDIHGDADAWALLLDRCRAHHGDELFLAGDIGVSSLPSLSLTPIPLVMVRGNCDSSYGFSEVGRPLPQLVQKQEWNGISIVMTHGDRYPTPYGMGMKEGDIFVFGHIHAARLYRDTDGIIILNPGSTTYPRGGYPASYAILDEKAITVRNFLTDEPFQTLDLRSR